MALIYTVIQHNTRKELGISCYEYILLDMVYQLSTSPESRVSGWCYMSREAMALEIGISRQSVNNLINGLEEKGLLNKDDKTKFLKTTSKWNNTRFTQCKESLHQETRFFTSECKESLHDVSKKFTPECKESLHNNNIDNNTYNNNLIIDISVEKKFETDLTKNDSEEKEKSCAKKEKEKRDLEFRDKVKSTVSEKKIEISDVEINKFCNYWTESSEKQIKMRFEKQDAFDISKRLATWIGNIRRDYPSNKHQRNFEQTVNTSLYD